MILEYSLIYFPIYSPYVFLIFPCISSYVIYKYPMYCVLYSSNTIELFFLQFSLLHHFDTCKQKLKTYEEELEIDMKDQKKDTNHS